MKRAFTDRGLDEVQYYNWRLTRWSMSETRDRLDSSGRGIYRELIDHCYGAGMFPDDQEWICRKCACSKADFKKWWPIIERHFPKTKKEGHRHNILADIWRKRYFGHLQSQRDNGRKGGRNSNQSNQVETDGLSTPDPSLNSQEPNPQAKERKKERKKIKKETAAAADVRSVGSNGFRWPAAAAAIREMFPRTSDDFVARIATACRERIRRDGGDPELLTDEALVELAIRYRKSNQDSAGLYIDTLPEVCSRFTKSPETGS